MSKVSLLICPKCSSSLVGKALHLECSVCDFIAPTNNSIIDLSDHKGYYWGEISPESAKEFIQHSQKNGFRSAVSRLDQSIPGMAEYILSYSRADWIFSATDFSKPLTVLDIGSGWGAITFALSYQAAQVWSLESVLPRLEFQSLRAKQEGRKNIHFVRSDWLRLPFANNSFDLISINGVLEWIGLSDFSKSPGYLQQSFLNEVFRILKPGGKVYIGIENRYALFLFLGALDHSGLPFTSLIPRKLADIVVKKYRRTQNQYDQDKRTSDNWPDYRTFTYSQSGYRQLLEKSGFSSPQFQWTLSYNSPTEAGKFDGNSLSYLLHQFKDHNFNSTKLARIATIFGALTPPQFIRIIFPLICPSFLIFASKDVPKPSFEDQIVTNLNPLGGFLRRSGTHGRDSKINYFLLSHNKPTHVVKFSRFNDFSLQLKQEEQLLSKYNDIKIKSLNLSGRQIFIEPYLDGKVCQTNSITDNQQVLDWLINFQSNSVSKKNLSSYILETAPQFLSILSTLNLDSSQKSDIQNQLREFKEISKSVNLPLTASHGDLVKTNIIFSKQKVHVIDWEFYQPVFNPLFDLLLFVIDNARVGTHPQSFISNFSGQGNYSPILKSLLLQYANNFAIPLKLLTTGVTVNLLTSLYRRLNDTRGRHLDTLLLTDTLKRWLEIYQSAAQWLLNK